MTDVRPEPRLQRLAELRAEVRECYRQEAKPVGRLEELSREIAELQEAEFQGRRA